MSIDNFKQWETAANSVAAGGVDMPADVQLDKAAKKKKKSTYDGRTREARKFFERLLARREAKQNVK